MENQVSYDSVDDIKKRIKENQEVIDLMKQETIQKKQMNELNNTGENENYVKKSLAAMEVQKHIRFARFSIMLLTMGCFLILILNIVNVYLAYGGLVLFFMMGSFAIFRGRAEEMRLINKYDLKIKGFIGTRVVNNPGKQ